ncbi:hypothetical protein ACJ73_00794 [Blastomyces percursus]|uniref:Uncharacterized protein n=1 Tax=Blastomyces percursus TaxID=1658174 RepID=A0A1J9RJM2_9EURO|nr:hypothetical protein ACJ73_00794 [Blastomyces percursus]
MDYSTTYKFTAYITITPASLRSAKKRQPSTSVATDYSSQETPPAHASQDEPLEHAQQRQKPQQQQRQSDTNHGLIFSRKKTVDNIAANVHTGTTTYKLTSLLGHAGNATSIELAKVLEYCNQISALIEPTLLRFESDHPEQGAALRQALGDGVARAIHGNSPPPKKKNLLQRPTPLRPHLTDHLQRSPPVLCP